MKSPPESPDADEFDDRPPAHGPHETFLAWSPPAPAPPESFDVDSSSCDATDSFDEAEVDEAEPYWVPAGVELDAWPPRLRAEVASIINPTYRELVQLAKPGLAQSTGITIVHLLWLEMLDQLQLSRQLPAPGVKPGSDPFQALGLESRKDQLERHLRLVHAKLKASELLMRLNALTARWQSQSEIDDLYPHLPPSPLRRR